MPHSGPAGEQEVSPREEPSTPDLELSHFLLHTCHDLRASLRAIRVHAELMVKERDAGEPVNSSQHLSAIVEGAGKLELLADGLAGYSIACQIDPGSFVLSPTEVLLRTALAKLSRDLRASGAEVTYDPLPRVPGAPDQLQHLFENLLRNAALHSGAAAPKIHISAEKQGECWLLRVRDNGPGIDSPYLERIFRPFERLLGRQAPGPGLGLTICRAIVEKHGGRMWAESPAGGGTTILFTLPAEPAPAS